MESIAGPSLLRIVSEGGNFGRNKFTVCSTIDIISVMVDAVNEKAGGARWRPGAIRSFWSGQEFLVSSGFLVGRRPAFG
jgi:hypothetical protein